ncbi:hypothetical protein AaE_004247 [Aphanomyces astaci]|uniref:Uncharacterized protein n=1 Tax=Aphanomyces astaci TaxID=112090 RepID=A0A6A5ARZ5_APHAT|nr:hypothetical protein AaE_004247 [Aphanomyces astaci]
MPQLNSAYRALGVVATAYVVHYASFYVPGWVVIVVLYILLDDRGDPNIEIAQPLHAASGNFVPRRAAAAHMPSRLRLLGSRIQALSVTPWHWMYTILLRTWRLLTAAVEAFSRAGLKKSALKF